MSDYIYLESDVFKGVVTAAAYFELRLQMSTGDFHTHMACPALPSFAAFFGYTEFDPETNELFDVAPELMRA